MALSENSVSLSQGELSARTPPPRSRNSGIYTLPSTPSLVRLRHLFQQRANWCPCLEPRSAPRHPPHCRWSSPSKYKPDCPLSRFKPFSLQLQDEARAPPLNAQGLPWASWPLSASQPRPCPTRQQMPKKSDLGYSGKCLLQKLQILHLLSAGNSSTKIMQVVPRRCPGRAMQEASCWATVCEIKTLAL